LDRLPRARFGAAAFSFRDIGWRLRVAGTLAWHAEAFFAQVTTAAGASPQCDSLNAWNAPMALSEERVMRTGASLRRLPTSPLRGPLVVGRGFIARNGESCGPNSRLGHSSGWPTIHSERPHSGNGTLQARRKMAPSESLRTSLVHAAMPFAQQQLVGANFFHFQPRRRPLGRGSI
jgi:hypothetical protein